MKYTLKIVLFGIGFFILNSCANSYKISTIDTINVNDYSIYVFRLCEKINVEGAKRFTLCDTDCKPNDIVDLKDIQVREELYLLVEKQGNAIIYLTTKTDRSFDLTPDIFNTEAHKNYVFANDLENVYFGILENNTISFTNKNETLSFKLFPRDNNSCEFVINTLQSNTKTETPINNRLVNLNDVYSVPLKFIASNRILAIQQTKKTELDTIKTINLTGKQIIFEGSMQQINRSQKRRLKYHPNFN